MNQPAANQNQEMPTATAPTTQPTNNGRRELPSDPAALDAALAPHKTVVKMMLKTMSSMMKQFELSPLDEGEIETGAEAWSAVLYENQVAFNAMTGALVWTASIGAPRVTEALEIKKRKAREAEARRRLESERAINPPPGRDTSIVTKAA